MRYAVVTLMIAIPTRLFGQDPAADLAPWRTLARGSSVVAGVTVTTPHIRVVRPEKDVERAVQDESGHYTIQRLRDETYTMGVVVRVRIDELYKTDAHAQPGGELEVFFPWHAVPHFETNERLLLFLRNPVPLDALGVEKLGSWSGLYGTMFEYPGDIHRRSEAFQVASAYGITLLDGMTVRPLLRYDEVPAATLEMAIRGARIAADRAAPAVELTAPLPNASVRGIVAVSGRADDDLELAWADVTLDGTSIGRFTSSPFTAYWDTTGLPAGSHTVTVTALDTAGNQAQTLPVTVAVAANLPPTVSLTASGTCGAGCTVTFASTASDPEGGVLARAWSGCASGSAASAICSRPSAGTLAATVTITDALGQPASASASVPVYASVYTTGPWSVCTGSGPYTCTAATATGCTRPATKTRTVAEAAWSLDAAAAASPPPASLPCTDAVPGYIATYNATYAANWTCTGGGATGCYKDLIGPATPATFRTTAPDAAPPATRIYTTGYVAGWNVGSWSGCSASCGTGWQTRSVTVSGWKPVAPDASRPGDTQTCNTQPCRLSCYDYGLYPTWPECYAEWPYCDTRYRDDGVGGLLTCRHGYN